LEQIIAPAIGARLAVDQIGGVNYPLSKLAFGAEDEATQVSPDTPFPTADSAVVAALANVLDKLIVSPATAAGQASTITAINALATLLGGTLAVSAASLPLPAGAATGAKQDTGNTSLAAIVTALAATLKVQTPIPAGIVTGQVALTANTTAQLPSAALVNGIVIKASANNTAPVLIGPSGVTTATDGTGTGYPLQPGEACSFALANANGVYARSIAAGVLFFEGN